MNASNCKTGEAPGAERWLEFRWFAVGLAFLLACRFHGVLLGTEAFSLRDFSMFGYPIAAHLQHSLFAGELPLWNPLSQAGMPFLAQWNTMCLYPPMLVAALFPLGWSLSVFCIAHLFLGGLGAWRLAHRFTGDHWAAALAGIAFAGNGLVQNSLMWPNNIAALAWMPWVLLLVESACHQRGRIFFVAALVAGLQMLTGGPEIILLTWLLAGGMVTAQAWQHRAGAREFAVRVGTFAALGAVTALLAAAQLLPFLDLLANSHREAGYADGTWALSGMAWAKFFTPLFGAIDAPGRIFYDSAQSWTHSVYAGLPILALAFVAPFIRPDRRVWIAASAALACLILAMGHKAYIYPWLAKIPPLNLLRYPVKFIIPLSLLLPLLAAIGFARIRTWDDAPESACCGRRVSILAGTILLGWAAAFALGWDNSRIERSDWVGNSLLRLTSLLIVGGALFQMIRRLGKVPVAVPSIVLLTVAIDLQIHQPNLSPTVPADTYTASTQALEELRTGLKGQSRAALTAYATKTLNTTSLPSLADTQLLRRIALLGNANLIDGLAKPDGFYSLYLKHYREVQMVFYSDDDEIRATLGDFLGLTHVMYHSNMFHWAPRQGAMPIVTGGQQPTYVRSEESLAFLASPNFNPRTQALLPTDVENEVKASATLVTISDQVSSAHHLQFQVAAKTNALIVIAQAYHPAWRAIVNGESVKVHRANHAFLGITVPPGISNVELSYVDAKFRYGCALSLLTLAVCLVGALRSRPTDKLKSCSP